jgi:hypothetical protein
VARGAEPLPPRHPNAAAEPLPPRVYGAETEVRRVARGLLDRSLPCPEWTHEAHLAAITVILLEHPDIVPERDLPAIIATYNVAVGGVNSDAEGYHETITRCWIAIARAFHAGTTGLPLLARVNGFIEAPEGRRDAPLRHYSPDRLFSVDARRRFVEPDRMPLPGTAG